jgi:hypothetical protein
MFNDNFQVTANCSATQIKLFIYIKIHLNVNLLDK